MQKSDSIKNLAMALNKAQGEMGSAIKGADNPFFNSKYADLPSVIKVIKQPFADNGLSYVQFPIEVEGRIGVETTLMHSSGEYISNSFTVPMKKQDAQSAGSVIKYCRRYSLEAVAGIPSEDDDGNKASGLKPNADDQGWVDAIKNGNATLESINDVNYRTKIQNFINQGL